MATTTRKRQPAPVADAAPEVEAPASDLVPLRPLTGAIGAHDESTLVATRALLAEKPEGVTIKEVAEATNLRVRLLENTLWRLSDQGKKYENPPLVRDNTKRPVMYRLAGQAK